MSSLNRALIIGRLGRDPEQRFAAGGMEIANFSLATSEKRKGEEVTEWHNCVAFDKTAEVVNKYAKKGGLIFAEGRIQTEKYTDKNGGEKYSTKILVNNIQLLSSRQDSGGRDEGESGGQQRRDQYAQQQRTPSAAKPAQRSSAPEFDDSEDIPFRNPYRGSFLHMI